MAKTKAQNLTRLEESLSGPEIEKLNELSPGLGAKIHKLFSNLGNIQAAQAGHSGTVVIAEQKKVDARGVALPAMKLQGQRIVDAADAKDDQDYVTLRQLRTVREEIEQELDERSDDLDIPRKAPCATTALTNPKATNTGLSPLYAVEVLNEFVYVLGAS